MRRNQWIMIATSIAAVLIIIAYFVWNNSRVVTGNVVPHTKDQIAYRTGPWEAGRGDIYILDTITGKVTQLTQKQKLLKKYALCSLRHMISPLEDSLVRTKRMKLAPNLNAA